MDNRQMKIQKSQDVPDNAGKSRNLRIMKRSYKRNRAFLCCTCILFLSIPIFEFAAYQKQDAPVCQKSSARSTVTASAAIKGSIKEEEDSSGIDTSAWNFILVNRTHSIPENLSFELKEIENGESVDSRIYQELQDMLEAARAEGLDPFICSSYRSNEKQVALFEEQVNMNMLQGYSREEAEKEAAVWVAPPGTSEHQLGLAVDIVSASYQMLDEAQEETPEQKWLMEHCAEYGFILRYPTDKSQITGIGYEPWHYRYVGREAAQDIMEQGICLEEYLSEQ